MNIMNRYIQFAGAILILLCHACGSGGFEPDLTELQDRFCNGAVNRTAVLKAGVNLFVDYSSCVKDAVRNSDFFAAVRPRITGLNPLLYSMRGSETVRVSDDMDVINRELNSLDDVPYADIKGTVELICSSDCQAILITDCEYWTKGEGERTNLPYLKVPFIEWINRGHVIYVVVERYVEMYRGKRCDKKRFYFFFTDDRLRDNVFEEIRRTGDFSRYGVVCHKLCNSDIRIDRTALTADENLTFDVNSSRSFDYVEIYDGWDIISRYVMEAEDDEGNPVAGGNPLIRGIRFSDYGNYRIESVGVRVSDITQAYCDSLPLSAAKDVSAGFRLDPSGGELKLRLTDRIFEYLGYEYGGNLFRVDFVVGSAANLPLPEEDFSWRSLSIPGTDNLSVYESIRQTLDNPAVNPARQNGGVIHTIFIKTKPYN
jgi:hypothetical protein